LRKPSVSALRPNLCASNAPAPAAASASTTCARPVRKPLRRADLLRTELPYGRGRGSGARVERSRRTRGKPARPGVGADTRHCSRTRGKPARPEVGADKRRLGGAVRIVVTGGGGFLGSHVVERLRDRGEEPFVARRADFDLTRWDDAERLFRETRPELVFHLAAEVGGIGANRANPGRYWYANLMMGAHVLELTRTYGVDKLVTAGTVCAYPKLTPVPFREADLWNGYPEETNAPYGIAKKTLLVGAQSYRVQYGTNAIFLLPANLYGPRDNFDLETSHVIPALVRKMVESHDEVLLWGDGSPTREFLYVEDCADGLMLAADRYDGGEPVNLGTSEEISIRDLAVLV